MATLQQQTQLFKPRGVLVTKDGIASPAFDMFLQWVVAQLPKPIPTMGTFVVLPVATYIGQPAVITDAVSENPGAVVAGGGLFQVLAFWDGTDWIVGVGGSGPAGTVTAVSGIAPIASTGGTTPAISLNDTAVTPGSYTYSALTVDQKGRLTAASSGTAPVTSVGVTAPIASTGGTTPTLSHNTTAVVAGSYTYSALTVDARGHLTAASSGTAPVTSVTGTPPIASSGGTTPAISLNNTAVTPGSYTNTNLTVDAQGRLTAASNGSGGTGTDYVVSGDGVQPPTPVNNGAGEFVYVVYVP